MKVEPDYEELLRLFNKNKVKYCVVGAFAVALHSKPRYTKDIDIVIEPSEENAGKILRALKEFGFESLHLSIDDFLKEDKIIQLGFEPVRIDILTSIEGCAFEDLWTNKETRKFGKEKVFFIGLNELIKNKTASDRPQYRIDLKSLKAKSGK